MSSWITVIADLVTIGGGLAIFTGFVVFRERISKALLAGIRSRALIPAFGEITRVERRHIRRENRRWVQDLMSRGGEMTAAEQLIWLNRLSTEVLGMTEPLTHCTLGSAETRTDVGIRANRVLRALPHAYRHIGGTLRARAAVGVSTSLLDGEAERCMQIATMLERYAHATPGHTSWSRERDGHRIPSPDVVLPRRGRPWIELHASTEPTGAVRSREVNVTWSPNRLVLEDPRESPTWFTPPLAYRAAVELLPSSPGERERAREHATADNRYDGVLPRLEGWRVERDEQNGWSRLHLHLSEVQYSACLLDSHLPESRDPDDAGRVLNEGGRGVADIVPARDGDGGGSAVTGLNANLMTISLAILTPDGDLIAVLRSSTTGSHASRWAPAVNGNLEMGVRRDAEDDLDPRGVPDPRRAIAREAWEEIGVRVDPGRMTTVGLARIDDDLERGTWVLLLKAAERFDPEEIRWGISEADDLKGAWEVEPEDHLERADDVEAGPDARACRGGASGGLTVSSDGNIAVLPRFTGADSASVARIVSEGIVANRPGVSDLEPLMSHTVALWAACAGREAAESLAAALGDDDGRIAGSMP